MLLRNKPRTRYILEDGTEVPGVTTILATLAKPNLMEWAHKLGLKGKSIDAGKSYAIDVGNITHYLIECFAKEVEPEIDPLYPKRAVAKAKKLAEGFYKYWEERELTCVESECKMISGDQRYGGTADLIVRTPEDEHELLDIKTSSKIWPEHIVQMVAYEELWYQNKGSADCGDGFALYPRVVLIPKYGELFAPDISLRALNAAYCIWHDLVPLYFARQSLNEELHKVYETTNSTDVAMPKPVTEG